MILKAYDDQLWEKVRIPHTTIETPFHYFSESIYQRISCYRRTIEVDLAWKGKSVLLTMEGVAHVAKVYLNGTFVASHEGGYTAFTVDIAPYLHFDEEAGENVLAIVVDSFENSNIPPFGKVVDYMTYGGIYREVYMEVKEETYIEDVFVYTNHVMNEEKEVSFEVELRGNSKENLTLHYGITPIHKEEEDCICTGVKKVQGQFIQINEKVTNVMNWDIDNPVRYQLSVELWEGENRLDARHVPFGFRSCEFKKDGFYLNHKKVKIIGLNRHQSYPYVGYAMPKRMQKMDAMILKKELGVNAVRTSHYPQSKHFIEACDELGILVFTEMPGWQFIGDEEWKTVAYQATREMIKQYRNHPSIVLWGVRINESGDDDAFYQKTNQIAHELDPTRQTGGVRCIGKSNLLEDVYTYNDFIHTGKNQGLSAKKTITSNQEAPYVVSEFNGHMFPTKSFDNEQHRLEHALRHARVLDALFEQEDIAGAFGWCMFDYNTHQEFGSGDRICYHGVMDMFRNPKLAASVYASQNNKEIHCEISSSMNMGEYPGCFIGDVVAFTNADCIRLYKNDQLIQSFYPSEDCCQNLPHPPIVINDFVGTLMEENEKISHKKAERIKTVLKAANRYGVNDLPWKYRLQMLVLIIKDGMTLSKGMELYNKYISNWGDRQTLYRFEAIKENEVVKVIEKRPMEKPRLKAMVDAYVLKEEETYDVSAVRILAVDEVENRLSYYQEPIVFEALGAIELIGPKMVSFKGGAIGTYVKTNGEKGEGTLILRQADVGEVKITFQVM
jgi:beta-galactosidase